MSYSEITLRLEYIVERGKRNPYEKVKEFSIAKYIVGAESVPGNPILALQINTDDDTGDNTYHVHRDANALPIDFIEEGVQVILFKLRWHSYRNMSNGLTSAHAIFDGETTGPIDENRGDLTWKYILKEKDGQYYLIRKVEDGAGIVLPCDILKDEGVDCSRPQNEVEEIDCLAEGCIKQAARPWWSKIFKNR